MQSLFAHLSQLVGNPSPQHCHDLQHPLHDVRVLYGQAVLIPASVQPNFILFLILTAVGSPILGLAGISLGTAVGELGPTDTTQDALAQKQQEFTWMEMMVVKEVLKSEDIYKILVVHGT